jgi:hypothetical protein
MSDLKPQQLQALFGLHQGRIPQPAMRFNLAMNGLITTTHRDGKLTSYLLTEKGGQALAPHLTRLQEEETRILDEQRARYQQYEKTLAYYRETEIIHIKGLADWDHVVEDIVWVYKEAQHTYNPIIRNDKVPHGRRHRHPYIDYTRYHALGQIERRNPGNPLAFRVRIIGTFASGHWSPAYCYSYSDVNLSRVSPVDGIEISASSLSSYRWILTYHQEDDQIDYFSLNDNDGDPKMDTAFGDGLSVEDLELHVVLCQEAIQQLKFVTEQEES